MNFLVFLEKNEGMQFTGITEEFLILKEVDSKNCHLLKEQMETSLSILWNMGSTSTLEIDKVSYDIEENQLVFITEFHHVKVKKIDQIRLVRFNRPFYCIKDHDTEVGCKGVLFYGASNVPIIDIPQNELEKFETLWKMFKLEMQSKDKLQIEMLQMMLTRFIILCTRLRKEQSDVMLDTESHDIVREFNYLVEANFKTKHTVAEYAGLLNKSPKTLSNFFAKQKQRSPLQIIQGRILLEARRLLAYTEMAVKEIAYEIGFDSVQTFSRFFKKKEGVSPVEYRKQVAY